MTSSSERRRRARASEMPQLPGPMMETLLCISLAGAPQTRRYRMVL